MPGDANFSNPRPVVIIGRNADLEPFTADDFTLDMTNGTAKVTVHGVPDRPGVAAALFEPLAGEDGGGQESLVNDVLMKSNKVI